MQRPSLKQLLAQAKQHQQTAQRSTPTQVGESSERALSSDVSRSINAEDALPRKSTTDEDLYDAGHFAQIRRVLDRSVWCNNEQKPLRLWSLFPAFSDNSDMNILR